MQDYSSGYTWRLKSCSSKEGISVYGRDFCKAGLGLRGKAPLSGPMGEELAAMKGNLDKMTTYARHFREKVIKGNYGPKQAKAYENTVKDLNKPIRKQVFLKGYQSIVMPTLATSHIAADYDLTKDKPIINGKQVHPLFGFALTPFFNLLNWYPVVSAPTGLSSKSSPQACRSSRSRTTISRLSGLRLTTPKPLLRRSPEKPSRISAINPEIGCLSIFFEPTKEETPHEEKYHCRNRRADCCRSR